MDSKRLKFKDYRAMALLYGIVYASIPIIISEILWDSLAKAIELTGLTLELIASFFRAALLEELFKFYGFWKADKEYKFINEREYMLAAGTIGLTYGIVEKFATGNVIAIVLGIIFPMHVLWQLNQGRHFYAYRKAKEIGEKKKAKHEIFMATFLIFIMHGCWDAILSIIEYSFADNAPEWLSNLGGILFLLLIAFGIFYIVISIKKTKKVLKNSKEDLQKLD